MSTDNIELFSNWFDTPRWCKHWEWISLAQRNEVCLTLHVPNTPMGRTGRPLKPSFLLTPKFAYAWLENKTWIIDIRVHSNVLWPILPVAKWGEVRFVLVFVFECRKSLKLVVSEPILIWRQREWRDRRKSPKTKNLLSNDTDFLILRWKWLILLLVFLNHALDSQVVVLYLVNIDNVMNPTQNKVFGWSFSEMNLYLYRWISRVWFWSITWR